MSTKIVMKDKTGNIKIFGQKLDAHLAHESGYYEYVDQDEAGVPEAAVDIIHEDVDVDDEGVKSIIEIPDVLRKIDGRRKKI